MKAEYGTISWYQLALGELGLASVNVTDVVVEFFYGADLSHRNPRHAPTCKDLLAPRAWTHVHPPA